MDMHVLARGDWGCGEANDLVVASHRLACSDRAHSDFVSSRNPVIGCNAVGNWRARQQGRARNYHVIVVVKANHRMGRGSMHSHRRYFLSAHEERLWSAASHRNWY